MIYRPRHDQFSIVEVDTGFFCDAVAMRGMVMGQAPARKDGYDVCVPIHKLTGYTNIIGLSLMDVVDIDAMKVPAYNHDIVGCRINIMTRGKTVVKFPKRLSIPRNQPIYVDFKTSGLTWKYSLKQCGRVLSTKSNDGYVVVEVNFQ